MGMYFIHTMLLRRQPVADCTDSVTPWVVNMGYQNAFLLGAGAGVAHTLTVFPIIKWGPYLRARSAPRYWKRLERELE